MQGGKKRVGRESSDVKALKNKGKERPDMSE